MENGNQETGNVRLVSVLPVSPLPCEGLSIFSLGFLCERRDRGFPLPHCLRERVRVRVPISLHVRQLRDVAVNKEGTPHPVPLPAKMRGEGTYARCGRMRPRKPTVPEAGEGTRAGVFGRQR